MIAKETVLVMPYRICAGIQVFRQYSVLLTNFGLVLALFGLTHSRHIFSREECFISGDYDENFVASIIITIEWFSFIHGQIQSKEILNSCDFLVSTLCGYKTKTVAEKL